jgi:hypothetical protein
MPQNALVRHRCTPSQMDEIFLEAPFSFQVLVLGDPSSRVGRGSSKLPLTRLGKPLINMTYIDGHTRGQQWCLGPPMSYTPSGSFDRIIFLRFNLRPSTTKVPSPIACMVRFSFRELSK